jgi:hypothetical protein
MHRKFLSVNLKERDRSEDLGVDGRKIGWETVECMHLALDRDQWRALVNTVNEPSGSIKGGEFLDYISDC